MNYFCLFIMKNLLKKLFLFTLFTLVMVGTSYASTDLTDNVMYRMLCNVYLFITGGIGKAVASFVIIGVGVGFFSGKVTWGVLIGVALGLSTLFGGPAILSAIAGGAAVCDLDFYDTTAN